MSAAERPLRVLLVNYDETRYGAARAVQRLRAGLLAQGVAAELLVGLRDAPPGPGVFGPPRPVGLARAVGDLVFDRLLALARHRIPRSPLFTVQALPDRAVRRIARRRPDVVHLHWLGNGFCRIESLRRLRLPIVWTLHDMWTFTGGCHYAGECTGYRTGCGRCPQLASDRPGDLSSWVWQRKARVWPELALTVTTPSRWLAERAAESPLLGGRAPRVIPNGLDPTVFRPTPREEARRRLGLPADARLVAFGAVSATTDRRKGFDLLVAALRRLAADGLAQGVELLVFGARAAPAGSELALPAHFLGHVGDDERLATVLSAADLFIAPSREDNLPNSVMEALACATPCLAFDVGGLADLIEHRRNGFLARPFDVAELAAGAAWILADPARRAALGAAGRAKVLAEFDQRLQAERFAALYREVVAAARGAA